MRRLMRRRLTIREREIIARIAAKRARGFELAMSIWTDPQTNCRHSAIARIVRRQTEWYGEVRV
jgi:hypothetical protein